MTTIEIVNEKILDQLKKGVIPWKKPWIGPRKAYSIASGRDYSLLNQLLLGLPGAYGTYEQWKRLGGQVRKNEKGHFVTFWKMVEKKTIDQNGKENLERYPVLRYYIVFHQSQITGVSIEPENMVMPPDPVEAADKVIAGYIDREKIKYTESEESDKAFYNPLSDEVVIPARKYFSESSASSMYSVIFHELAHSTGHSSRLDRPGLKKVSFGSEIYSAEELVAEIASCYILESLGISTDLTIQMSASYIDGWSKAIRSDGNMIVKAAPAAEKAAKLILGTCKIS